MFCRSRHRARNVLVLTLVIIQSYSALSFGGSKSTKAVGFYQQTSKMESSHKAKTVEGMEQQPPYGQLRIKQKAPVFATQLHSKKQDEEDLGVAPSNGLDVRGGEESKIELWQYLTLGSLMLIYIHNQWSRTMLVYLVNFDAAATTEAAREFMNVALNFDKTQFSLLASFGFTLLYSVTSIFAGRAADVVNKKTLAIGAATLWSATTLATGMASTFEQVFGLRVLTGLAQAFTNPAAYSLLAQSFPADRRGFANSVYASGAYYGGGLASLTVLLSATYGWRATTVGVGALGLGLALVGAAAVSGSGGPAAADAGKDATAAAAAAATGDQPGFREAVGTVLASPTVRALFLASAVRFCAGYGIGTWTAPYLRGAFPDYTAQYALLNTVVVGTGGVISSTLGGLLSDQFIDRDPRVRAWTCAAGCLLALPCWAALCLSPSFYGAMAALFLEYVAAECWFGPVTAVLQDALPANVRGVGQGLFGFLITVGNLAPVAMGLAMERGATLQATLLWGVGGLYLAAALLFLRLGEVQLAEQRRAKRGE